MTKVTGGMKGVDSAFLRSTSGSYNKSEPTLGEDNLYHTESTYDGSGWQVDYHPGRAQIVPAAIGLVAFVAAGGTIPTLVTGLAAAVLGFIGI